MRERLFRERIFFFAMVLVLIVIAFILIWPFVTPILFALAMIVILKPLYNRLLIARWIKGSESRAAAATLVIFSVDRHPCILSGQYRDFAGRLHVYQFGFWRC